LNLRHPDFIKAFIKNRYEAGDAIIIVTGHPNPLHVASYIGTLFDDEKLKSLEDHEQKSLAYQKYQDWYKYYVPKDSYISCIFSADRIRYDENGQEEYKNADIEVAVTQVLNKKFVPEKIVLIDDAKGYVDAAKKAKYEAIWAEPDTRDYIDNMLNLAGLSKEQFAEVTDVASKLRAQKRKYIEDSDIGETTKHSTNATAQKRFKVETGLAYTASVFRSAQDEQQANPVFDGAAVQTDDYPL